MRHYDFRITPSLITCHLSLFCHPGKPFPDQPFIALFQITVNEAAINKLQPFRQCGLHFPKDILLLLSLELHGFKGSKKVAATYFFLSSVERIIAASLFPTKLYHQFSPQVDVASA